SGEQSTGIEQINRAVVQMESVTQQNAALVEEAAAAAASLEEQAAQLDAAVAAFHVEARSLAKGSHATAPRQAHASLAGHPALAS
ncbi:MAG: methyl-accepting chemotaxis protein, partial [Trinickia sp.]